MVFLKLESVVVEVVVRRGVLAVRVRASLLECLDLVTHPALLRSKQRDGAEIAPYDV